MDDRQPKIRMQKERPPCHAAGGVNYRHSRSGAVEVLLIKKRSGGWSLPKGVLKTDESDAEALRREVAEETALRGAIGAFLHEFAYTVTRRRHARLKIVRYYLVGGATGKPRPGRHEGIRKVRWFDLTAAIRHAHNDRVRTVLERAWIELRNGPSAFGGPQPLEHTAGC
jgi:8-oxo-dGTP pyrophosphatase MutT (NUDIX family)